jgi:type I restriction enzyme R subunit
MPNQNPEQIARDQIDKQLSDCGWLIQDKSKINLHAGLGVAVREYLTDVGPADYVLFVSGKPVGVIEAKREEEGHKLNEHEAQVEAYAKAKLKHLNNEPLPFVYLSTGEITKFINNTDPKPRADIVLVFIDLKPYTNGLSQINPYVRDCSICHHYHPKDCVIVRSMP